MKKVLICDHFSKQSIKALEDKGYSLIFSKTHIPTADELFDVDGLLIRSRTLVNKNLLNSSKKLKVIVSATAGFDHIDYNICIERKIKVMHTPQANAQSAAELTLALVLSQLRSIPIAHTNLTKNQKWRESLTRGNTLNNASVGIIGLGRIGFKVAKFCHAIGAKVYFYDPYVESDEFEKVSNLELLLKQSKIISLHVPYTQKTKHMISYDRLALLPKGSLLINCSRGKVVNQKDLLQFIKSQPDFKVALDVFYEEPCKDLDLFNLAPQVMVTPHIGAYTQEALKLAGVEATQKLDNYFDSQQVSDPVPPNAAWAKDL